MEHNGIISDRADLKRAFAQTAPALRIVDARPRRMQDLQTLWRTKYLRVRGAGLLLGIIDALFATPVISPQQVAKQLRVSHPAAMQALRRLENDQVLEEATGKKRNRLCVAPEIMKVIE